MEDVLSGLRRNICTGDFSRHEKLISLALVFESHFSGPEVFVLAELIEAIVWEEFVHLSRQSAANIRSKLILSLGEDIFSLFSDFLESIYLILILFFFSVIAALPV